MNLKTNKMKSDYSKLNKTSINIIDLLKEAKGLLEDQTESDLYNDVQHIINAFKIECNNN
jgi:hypothetical protein